LFPRANPLAYWASSTVKKEKSFITFTPGLHPIILLFFVAVAAVK
jgi:hypothetical protein